MNYLKQIQILFIGVAMGPVIFLAVILFLQSGSVKIETDYNHPLLYISVIVSTFAVIGSILINSFRLAAIKAKPTAKEKLDEWKKMFILRIAIIEGACMFNLACLLIQEFDIFLYIGVALIALQFMNFPSRNRIQSDLNLNVEETAGL